MNELTLLSIPSIFKLPVLSDSFELLKLNKCRVSRPRRFNLRVKIYGLFLLYKPKLFFALNNQIKADGKSDKKPDQVR